MMKTLKSCVLLALAAILLLACNRTEYETAPNRRVFVMYAAAFSNLSSNIAEDVNELCAGAIPSVGSEDILLVYSHHLKGSHLNLTNPVLFRAYRDLEGVQRRDTLVVYPDTDISSTPEVLNKVLTKVKEMFPARSYGLLFSSHGRGWLPVNYEDEVSTSIWTFDAPRRRQAYPETKWLGIEYPVEASGIDIRDLADAIPMKLDFFLMDACLMGGIEVAYELRNTCHYLVFSPTEILSNGFMYDTMASHLMNIDEPELQQLCQEYFDYYNSLSGLYRAATITMVDCTRAEALADVCAGIIASHRDSFLAADRNHIQHYFYQNGDNTYPWFYDLRDVFEKAGATGSELASLDAALDNFVVYSAATPKFFDLALENVCGLSMYFPYSDRIKLNTYYKSLSWNKATGLLQ